MSFWTPDAKEDAFMASRKEAERRGKVAGSACTTCGGDSQLLTALECADCEGTGFEREKPMDVLHLLKGKQAPDGGAVMVSHALLKAAVETIERLREGATCYMDEIERLRAWYDASQDAMGEVLTELRKQTEMLERIRREQVRGE